MSTSQLLRFSGHLGFARSVTQKCITEARYGCAFITKHNNTRWQTTASSQSKYANQASREAANYQARVNLATAYRGLDFYGLGEGVCNHLSMRAPSVVRNEDIMLLIPYGLHWKEVTASCLIGVDFITGEHVEGDGEPNVTASCIHRPIHNSRYPVDGITAVMHTHQPYTTTIACMDGAEPFHIALSQNSMRFANVIAYDKGYDGFANEQLEGERLASVLGDKTILMMERHGVLAVGKRACDAFDLLYYMERAAQLQVLLMSTGAKITSAPPHIVKSVANEESYKHSAFLHQESMKRILAKEKPSLFD